MRACRAPAARPELAEGETDSWGVQIATGAQNA